MPLSEPVLALQRRQQMDKEAAALRQHQADYGRHFARRHARRPLAAPAPRGRMRAGQSANGWPVLWAFIVWLGRNMDYVSAHYDQHIQPRAGEVLMLPFETLTFVGSSSWSQLTVVPGTLNPVHDSGTGLDTLNQDSNAPWGIDPNGQPYYDTEGAPGPAHVFVDNTGQPFITP